MNTAFVGKSGMCAGTARQVESIEQTTVQAVLTLRPLRKGECVLRYVSATLLGRCQESTVYPACCGTVIGNNGKNASHHMHVPTQSLY
jgi:hypothetical protein